MTDERQGNHTVRIVVNGFASALIFTIAMLTGNCHCAGCGFDKDYVEMWSAPDCDCERNR